MNVKEIRENMTEEALSIESSLRRYCLTAQEVSDMCSLSLVEVNFILEQMILKGLVKCNAIQRYSLTPEYKNGNF